MIVIAIDDLKSVSICVCMYTQISMQMKGCCNLGWSSQKVVMIIPEGEAEEKGGVQGSAEAVKEAVLALAGDVVGIRLVSQEVGPVTTTDIDTAAAVGASILAFNVKYANAAVEGIAKLREVPVVQQNIIYRLLEQVCHWQCSPFLATCLSHILSAPESSRSCSSHGFAALTELLLTCRGTVRLA